MTNSVAEFKVTSTEIAYIRTVMDAIACDYNVRICTEVSDNSSNTLWPRKDMAFTNATFGHVFGFFMQATTNLTWRYENSSDSIYIYPTTNSITMMRCGPVSFTNELAFRLFKNNDVFNLGTNRLVATAIEESDESWMMEKISLDVNEMYLWEALDAVQAQLRYTKYWHIWDGIPDDGFHNKLYFYDKHHDSWRTYWCDPNIISELIPLPHDETP